MALNFTSILSNGAYSGNVTGQERASYGVSYGLLSTTVIIVRSIYSGLCKLGHSMRMN